MTDDEHIKFSFLYQSRDSAAKNELRKCACSSPHLLVQKIDSIQKNVIFAQKTAQIDTCASTPAISGPESLLVAHRLTDLCLLGVCFTASASYDDLLVLHQGLSCIASDAY